MNRQNMLKKIIGVFNESDVPCVLIGAFALAAWGIVRATRDMDFLADIPNDKISKIKSKLKENGFNVEFTPASLDDPVRGALKINYGIDQEEETVDVLLGIKNMPTDIYNRACEIEVLGSDISVVSPEDLIVLKLIGGSQLDILDVKSITAVLRDKLDMQYINKICKSKKLKFDTGE